MNTNVEKMKKTLSKSVYSGFQFESVFEAKLEFDIPKMSLPLQLIFESANVLLSFFHHELKLSRDQGDIAA